MHARGDVLAALNSGTNIETATESSVTMMRWMTPSALLMEIRRGSASFAARSSGALSGRSMPRRIWIAVLSGWVVSANFDLWWSVDE